jgi:hypothetical protein
MIKSGNTEAKRDTWANFIKTSRLSNEIENILLNSLKFRDHFPLLLFLPFPRSVVLDFVSMTEPLNPQFSKTERIK